MQTHRLRTCFLAPFFKNLSIFFLGLASLDASAQSASACGAQPVAPQLLSQSQITLDQLEALKSDMQSYKGAVETFIDCVETVVEGLVPDTSNLSDEVVQSEAFLETPEFIAYQSEVDALNGMIDITFTQVKSNTQLYNQLVVSAVPATEAN